MMLNERIKINVLGLALFLASALCFSGCASDPDLVSFSKIEEQVNAINSKYYSLYYVHPNKEDFEIEMKWRAVNTAFIESNEPSKTNLVKDLSFKLEWNIRGQKFDVLGIPDGLSKADSDWLNRYSSAMMGQLSRILKDLRLFFYPTIISQKRDSKYKFLRRSDGFVIEAHHKTSNRKIVSTLDVDSKLILEESFNLKTGELVTQVKPKYLLLHDVFYLEELIQRKAVDGRLSEDRYTIYKMNYNFSIPKFPLTKVYITGKNPRVNNQVLTDDMIEFHIIKDHSQT